MHINVHGATAGHLASWKNHVECLRVLSWGYYADDFSDDSDESNMGCSVLTVASEMDEDEEGQGLEVPGHRYAIVTTPLGINKTWSTDWNHTDASGETPFHVAAREGCLESMQFFLDLAVTSAASAMSKAQNRDENALEESHLIDISGSGRYKDINTCTHVCQPNHTSSTPCTVDFSIRNNEGMDCTALAAMHNRAKIIALMSRTIEKLVDYTIVEDEGRSHWQEWWDNPLSYYFQPQSQEYLHHSTNSPAPKPPPQSLRSSIRRRAKSEPVNIIETSVKPPQSAHRHSKQQLPTHFPSLNLRNSLERYNHEMPIHVAARHGNSAVIEALFESGACDVAARDSFGQTALHVAVLMGHLDVCRFFVELNEEQFQVSLCMCLALPCFCQQKPKEGQF